MCGRAGCHGAERWQETGTLEFDARRPSFNFEVFFAMMSRVTFAGVFFFIFIAACILSGTIL